MTLFEEFSGLLQKRVVQLFALCGILGWVAQVSLDYKYSVRDNDTWWHLSVGNWILAHRAVPHTGIFSATAAHRPWMAYSWGYEIILSRAYHWFGLMGIAALGIALTMMIAYAVFWSLLRLCGRFWEAWFLSACSLFTFLFILMPRPVFVSILFYVVLLTLLLEANRSGNIRPLYWLPLLFLVWANIHIQFIYGLFVLGLFAGGQLLPTLTRRFPRLQERLRPATLPLVPLWAVFFLCAFATIIGPYGYNVYRVIFEYSRAKVSYNIILELQPFTFRNVYGYLLLALTCGGFIALGWRQRLDTFKLLLLIFAAVSGFRTVRDCWFLAYTAAALMADFPAPEASADRGENWWERTGLITAVLLIIALLSPAYHFNEPDLERTVSTLFPVDAVNYLRRNPLPPPLYNNLDWGGFLIWYMPQYPVAIDGRNDLYGDKLDSAFFAAQSGVNYKNSKYLNEAGCILLEKKYALAKLLRMDPRFKLVYEDPITVVYARR